MNSRASVMAKFQIFKLLPKNPKLTEIDIIFDHKNQKNRNYRKTVVILQYLLYVKIYMH